MLREHIPQKRDVLEKLLIPDNRSSNFCGFESLITDKI